MIVDAEDVREFPIQGQMIDRVRYPACKIPWWIAEVAYREYARQFGADQSMERPAARGGFGRGELMALLRGERLVGSTDDSWLPRGVTT